MCDHKSAVPGLISILLFASITLADDKPPKSPLENDPVAERLKDAEDEYTKADSKAKAPVLKRFDAAMKKARDAGDLESVKRIKKEREAFESKGARPTVVPVGDYQKKMAGAKAEMVQAYTEAKTAYLKAEMDDKADAVAKALADFRKDASLTVVRKNGEWVPLFNGENLDGWKVNPASNGAWKVVDGCIVGSDPRTPLLTIKDDYANFRLRVKVKISEGVDGGIGFRIREREVRGYESQLNLMDLSDEWRTGSLLSWRDKTNVVSGVRPGLPHIAPNEWFVLQLLAKGGEIGTLVNGQLAAEMIEQEITSESGAIGIMSVQPSGKIWVESIEIMEMRR